MVAAARRLVAIGLLLVATFVRADTIHLKNGGSIVCDAIEERGTDLVLKVGKMTIVVPRDEVERIDKSPPSPAGGTPPAGGTSSSRPPATAAPPAAAPGDGKTAAPAGDAKADAARL